MIKKNIEFEESFFENFGTEDADKVKLFLKDLDVQLRTKILELEKTPDIDPVLIGIVMRKEINSILNQVKRPDFGDLGMDDDDLDNFIEYVVQEALSDYYRQFENNDEQILIEMRIINNI